MKKMKFLVVVLSILTLILSGCGTGSTGTGTGSSDKKAPLRIGVEFPLSGALANVGQDNYAGVEIAKDIVNGSGGVNGQQIELVKGDIPDPTAAVNETNRLISQEKVKVIVGAYSSSLSLAATEVTEKNKTIFWEVGAVDPTITGRGYKYVFRTTPNSNTYSEIAMNYLGKDIVAKLGKQPADVRLAIVHEDGAFGESSAKIAAQKAKELGLNLVANESYNSKAIDLSALVLKLKEAKPDIVEAVQYNNDAILFWKQAKDLDLNVKAIIGIGAGHSSMDFVKARGGDVNGVLVSTPTASIKTDALPPETQQVLKQFQDKYKAKYNKEASTQVLTAFSGAWIFFKDVLPKAGSDNPDKIREAALALDIPEGHTVNGWGVKFGQNGQNTRSFSVVMQWQDGKLVTISPDKYALGKPILIPLPTWAERGKK
ncbi:MAG: ABC transporter substrate-binding protein [Desulfitobacteriaceae bacterium]|nr:ABC transporter substrate-binding protein [Desulfitobacteriaceae bacterium]MDI6914665.1 ABC transporter substrate-binding protein [Desulfitobacteriaceae bacterium]